MAVAGPPASQATTQAWGARVQGVVAWGLMKEHPDYLAVARQINRIDLYKQAASAAKVSVPKDVMRTSKLIDGTVWDGKDPKKYADSFKVHA